MAFRGQGTANSTRIYCGLIKRWSGGPTLLEVDEGPLAAAREKVARHEDAVRARALVECRLAEVSRQLPALSATAAARRRDVERLRRGVVARLTGRHSDRLAAAVAAAEEAERRLRQQQTRRREIIVRRLDIDRELAFLRDAAEAYERAVADAERDLAAAADPRGAELVALNDEVARLRATLRGYERALRAGHGALSALASVLAPLGQAELLSTVDLFVGGVIDIWEHDQLKEAKEAALGAQRSLDHFASELAHLGRPADPLPMGKISDRWFVDMVFDNLVVDLLKHRRIERAHDRVAAARRWVLVSITRLELDQRAATRELARLTADRDRLLLGAAGTGPGRPATSRP